MVLASSFPAKVTAWERCGQEITTLFTISLPFHECTPTSQDKARVRWKRRHGLWMPCRATGLLLNGHIPLIIWIVESESKRRNGGRRSQDLTVIARVILASGEPCLQSFWVRRREKVSLPSPIVPCTASEDFIFSRNGHFCKRIGNCSRAFGYVKSASGAPARVRRIASRAPMERRRAVSMTERMSA